MDRSDPFFLSRLCGNTGTPRERRSMPPPCCETASANRSTTCTVLIPRTQRFVHHESTCHEHLLQTRTDRPARLASFSSQLSVRSRLLAIVFLARSRTLDGGFSSSGAAFDGEGKGERSAEENGGVAAGGSLLSPRTQEEQASAGMVQEV